MSNDLWKAGLTIAAILGMYMGAVRAQERKHAAKLNEFQRRIEKSEAADAKANKQANDDS